MEVETVEVSIEDLVAMASGVEAVVMVVLEKAVLTRVVLTEAALTEVQERCIKQSVQNAIKNVKSLLNQQKANLSIARTVFKNTGRRGFNYS